MPSTATDRLAGATASVAVKAPCRVATTANIALSGLQTVDGVALVAGDRVLVKDQAVPSQNGIWVAGPSAWTRARDFDGARDAVTGTLVPVNEGTLGAGFLFKVTTANPVSVGTSDVAFAASTFTDLAVSSYWQGILGGVSVPLKPGKGADIPSAATLALGTDGGYFDVTGSTGPISAVTVAAGTVFMLQFDATPTLVHHATNLNLPGGANIVAATGDRLLGFATGTNTVHVLDYVRANGRPLTYAGQDEAIVISVTEDNEAVAAATSQASFRMPFAFTLTSVRASLVTAQTSGNILTVDINESGSSILSTKLTIVNTEKTSATAVTAAVISDAALADDAEITIDVDQIGDGTAKGLKVTLIGYRT